MRRPFDVYDFPFRHNDMVVAPFCDEWVDLMANILEGNIGSAEPPGCRAAP